MTDKLSLELYVTIAVASADTAISVDRIAYQTKIGKLHYVMAGRDKLVRVSDVKALFKNPPKRGRPKKEI